MESTTDCRRARSRRSMRQALDAELALHDTMEGYDRAFVTERAYALSSFREIPGAGFWLLRGFQNRLALSLIELIDRYRQKGSRPYAEVVKDKKECRAPGCRHRIRTVPSSRCSSLH